MMMMKCTKISKNKLHTSHVEISKGRQQRLISCRVESCVLPGKGATNQRRAIFYTWVLPTTCSSGAHIHSLTLAQARFKLNSGFSKQTIVPCGLIYNGSHFVVCSSQFAVCCYFAHIVLGKVPVHHIKGEIQTQEYYNYQCMSLAAAPAISVVAPASYLNLVVSWWASGLTVSKWNEILTEVLLLIGFCSKRSYIGVSRCIKYNIVSSGYYFCNILYLACLFVCLKQ